MAYKQRSSAQPLFAIVIMEVPREITRGSAANQLLARAASCIATRRPMRAKKSGRARRGIRDRRALRSTPGRTRIRDAFMTHLRRPSRIAQTNFFNLSMQSHELRPLHFPRDLLWI